MSRNIRIIDSTIHALSYMLGIGYGFQRNDELGAISVYMQGEEVAVIFIGEITGETELPTYVLEYDFAADMAVNTFVVMDKIKKLRKTKYGEKENTPGELPKEAW